MKQAFSFGLGHQRRRIKHDISYILGRAHSLRNQDERVVWFQSLVTWIRSTTPVTITKTEKGAPTSTHIDSDGSFASTRIRFILHLCDHKPEWGEAVGATLAQLASELSATDLFCDVGIFNSHSIFGQLNAVLIDRFLPVKGGKVDLDQLVTLLFPNESDVSWVEALTSRQIKHLLTLVEGSRGPLVWAPFRRSFADGMLILASQASGASTEREMRERVDLGDLPTSAFFRLLTAVQRLHPRLEGSIWVGINDVRELNDLQEVIQECVTRLNDVFVYFETHGVSIDLVFRFERIERLLARLSVMTDFLLTAARSTPETGLSSLVAELIRASLDAHHVSRIFGGKIRLLSRRIVEHTGDSGDHYITRDRKGYFQMLLSAGGGGFFTVGTSILKAAIARFELPAMLEAFAHAANYAGSFLTMHFCHFTLATKQPSMTASTLARKLSAFARGTDSQEIIATIRDAFRSQFAAALGNVVVAIPTAALITWLYQRTAENQVFSEVYAHKVIKSLDPLTTLTIFYAAFTGVLLWLASIFSGLVENWVLLHKMAQRIEHSPYLHFWLGKPRTKRLMASFTKNLPGVSGSIGLGFLLALIPFLGVITGFPLDVRHVTLSSSALSVAIMTLGETVDRAAALRAAIGVGLTGLMNFGVSFFLALIVASRAQNVRRSLLSLIGMRVIRSFFRAPLGFFWPDMPTQHQARHLQR